jgi:surfactin synthase thioesterase subunit
MARNENPFLIFGHSMGANLGLHVAKKLEELGDLPLRLIVAGNAGPGISERKSRSTMSDDELKEELRTLGGVPGEVLDNEELYNFFMPILRSDFKVLESGNELSSDFRLKTPITAIMGSNEEHAEQIDNWKNFTFNDFKSYLLGGNHFFIHDHPAELVKIIAGQDD